MDYLSIKLLIVPFSYISTGQSYRLEPMRTLEGADRRQCYCALLRPELSVG